MEYLVKKTYDLSEAEKLAIAALHLRVFKRELPLAEFNRKFGLAGSGYSYHGLILDKGVVIGNYAAIPYRYQYFGKPHVFALAVDGMIDEQYRDFHSYSKIAKLVYEALRTDGIPFIYCFPNEQAYLYTKKILTWEDIGDLNYFIQPLRPGALKKVLSIFNWLFLGWSRLSNKIVRHMDLADDQRDYNIQKVTDDSFKKFRYDNTYTFGSLGMEISYVYRIYVENGVRIAYLIDIDPLNKVALGLAVAEINRRESKYIDLILYIGRLEKVPLNLIRIPGRLEPKKVKMTGKILLPDIVDERVFDLNNWRLNIASFDIR